jgi:hypothetical protein
MTQPRIVDILSTQAVAVSTTPTDISLFLPDHVETNEAFSILFHGDQTVQVNFGNVGKTVFMPAPASVYSEMGPFDRDRILRGGFKYLFSAAPTTCTITIARVSGI